MYGETSARLFELFFGPISMAVPLIESSCKADSANVIYSMHPMGRWGGIVGNSREWVWCLHGLPLWVYWYSLLQLICGDHCLAFSNQSTGQELKQDNLQLSACAIRQSLKFSLCRAFYWKLSNGHHILTVAGCTNKLKVEVREGKFAESALQELSINGTAIEIGPKNSSKRRAEVSPYICYCEHVVNFW